MRLGEEGYFWEPRMEKLLQWVGPLHQGEGPHPWPWAETALRKPPAFPAGAWNSD